MKTNWQCRIAPSLGEFEGTPNDIWGTKEYTSKTEPTCFFGLYGFPDFFALWSHKGIREILWCGSDITNFKNGYWMDETGDIRINPQSLVKWITRNCGCWVENKVERQALEELGIPSRIVPSFLGNVKDFKLCYRYSKVIKVYTSVSGDEFELYGWHLIPELAQKNPEIEFHLYGSNACSLTCSFPLVINHLPNIIIHGKVDKETMNAEIKKMTGALRLTRFDGFSEIIAKSILWGQWPVSPFINYPHMCKSLSELKNRREPNIKGREHYLKIINRFPWVK